jgi:hypothetical protein
MRNKMSRRRRKRERRQAEAIVKSPRRYTGGWGGGPEDVGLVRQAVRQDWPTQFHISQRILREMTTALEIAPDARTVLRVARLFIEIDERHLP